MKKKETKNVNFTNLVQTYRKRKIEFDNKRYNSMIKFVLTMADNIGQDVDTVILHEMLKERKKRNEH